MTKTFSEKVKEFKKDWKKSHYGYCICKEVVGHYTEDGDFHILNTYVTKDCYKYDDENGNPVYGNKVSTEVYDVENNVVYEKGGYKYDETMSGNVAIYKRHFA